MKIPHVHFRGEVRYNAGTVGDDVDTIHAFHHRLSLPKEGSLIGLIGDAIKELQADMKFREIEVRYRFDKTTSAEYVRVDAVDLENINLTIRSDIFTCHNKDCGLK